MLFDKYSKMVLLQSLNEKNRALKYTIKLSKSIDLRDGIGLIPIPDSDSKIHRDQIETEGLKWNIGIKHGLKTLSWSTMISTSNQIVGLDNDDSTSGKWTIKVKSYGKPLLLSSTLKFSKDSDDNKE